MTDELRDLPDLKAAELGAEEDAVRMQMAKAGSMRKVPHPTVAEREAAGVTARAHASLEQLAQWHPPADRADPVALLASQETSRVQELLPVRHARMAASAFAFYRGGALIMAADLDAMPRSGVTAQLCGDAHLANFGLFGAPDRSLVFDVNDFDETNPGPFEWDVKRLAASFVLAARDASLSDKAARRAAEAVASTYRASMQQFACRRELDIWYDRVDVSALQSALPAMLKGTGAKERRKVTAFQDAVDASVAKARSRDAWSAIAKITEVVDGKRRFRNEPPLLARLDVEPSVLEMVDVLFREYRATLQDDRRALLQRYEVVDIGHKVVGVGSVGLLALVLLMRGRDEDDLMVLQVKQAQASVLEAYTHKSAYAKHGHRVVTGQRLMQAASDSFLGWIDGPGGRSFYVRQLRDMKWSPTLSTVKASGLRTFAQLCGHTLARAHARSGDAIATAAYLGESTAFDDTITEFSMNYADQVAQDFAAFTAAISDGRIVAHEDDQGKAGIAAAGRIAEATQKA